MITQFPFAEKIVAPYILMLVTTPMLALVPLLILRFGFGYEPPHHRGRPGFGADGDDQLRHGISSRRLGEDRAGPLLRSQHVPDFSQDPDPDGPCR